MQTFLPYGSFLLSAQVLDDRRLGNQRNEAFVLLNEVLGLSTGWQHHPAVRMWADYPAALCTYGMFICREWIARGHRDQMLERFRRAFSTIRIYRDARPWWLGMERLHSSHRAALLLKNLSHYEQFGWTEKPELAYWWPGRKRHVDARTRDKRPQVPLW